MIVRAANWAVLKENPCVCEVASVNMDRLWVRNDSHLSVEAQSTIALLVYEPRYLSSNPAVVSTESSHDLDRAGL